MSGVLRSGHRHHPEVSKGWGRWLYILRAPVQVLVMGHLSSWRALCVQASRASKQWRVGGRTPGMAPHGPAAVPNSQEHLWVHNCSPDSTYVPMWCIWEL